MLIIPQVASENTGEILVDKSVTTGKERPWRDKHLAGQKVSAAYSALGKRGKAARCRDCGTVLMFSECPVDGQKRLKMANFCKERLCPMCAWRRSLKWSAEVSLVLHKAAEQNPKWGYVMLTFTQRNVPSTALADEISRILSGWRKASERQEFRAVAGWLRVLEITRNEKDGTWHPHIHALLAVEPDYWHKQYVSQKRWRELWADVLGLDYDPSVEVHRVKARNNGDILSAAAREVGKYTVKDSDLIGDGTDVIARVEALDTALKGRRLIAWGGALRLIAQQIKPERHESEEDLVRITGEDHGRNCPVCGTEMLPHVYRWVHAIRQYVG